MIKKLIISCLLLFTCMQSYAILDLELTQGVAAAVPIAVVPFKGVNLSSGGLKSLSDIVIKDLQNSGEFRVINQGSTTDAVGAEAWSKQGADYLIVGKVEQTKSQGYLVHYTLQSLVHSDVGSEGKGEILLNETYSSNSDSLRSLAHHISDEIYEKLTGVKGIFSTRIAYILVHHPGRSSTRYNLVVADADGYNPQALLRSTQPIMSPAWSPSGSSLAYVSFEGHHAAIYLQNLSSGKRELISSVPGINGAPAFSPDGKKVALVLTKTGSPKIYLLDINTKKLQQISFGTSIDTEPAFSPDGSAVLFTSNRAGSPQIYQYSIPTGSLSRLTFDGDYNARGSFSPDGQAVIMMRRDHGAYGIARLDLSSGRTTVLSSAGNDESPSIAPNGKMIIYATEYSDRGVLAQVSMDGKIKLRLPAREGAVQDPAWSPFLT